MFALQLQQRTAGGKESRTPESLIRARAAALTLPAYIARLSRMIDDPACSAADIAREIERNPARVARLLRIVEAAGYARPHAIGSAAEAMVLLGARQLRDLLLAGEAVQLLSAGGAGVETLWRHGFAAALLARSIAEELRVRRTERYFLIGLFHHIGLPALHAVAPGEAAALLDAPAGDRSALARQRLGFAPAELGVALLRHWRLPESVTAAIACLGEPDRAECYRREAVIGRLACASAAQLATPACNAPGHARRAEAAPLPRTTLERLARGVAGRLDALAAALGPSGQEPPPGTRR